MAVLKKGAYGVVIVGGFTDATNLVIRLDRAG